MQSRRYWANSSQKRFAYYATNMAHMIYSRTKIYFLLFLILIPQIIKPQQKSEFDAFKRAALTHMQAGRYGEAIDQLNKYVSANAQDSEGYNLIALCYEKRQQYELARLDFRRAIALETTSPSKKAEYEKNLQRVIDTWYPLLYKKIQGHLREIAINAANPFNYLEIGKTYKLLEIWDKSEQWYDEYLRRDDNASPDEIIRYTEVLAKTGSIVKGEKILKKYVERYPQDNRLWSRYGYFTLWLGKYQIAKKAFETSLSLKPFFKEAQDGLDMVNNKAYMTLENPRAFEREYPIDRYYRILRKNPKDVETRFKLVDELITANRIEEAYQQLQIIGVTQSEDQRYKDKWTQVTDYRTKTYQAQLDSAKAHLTVNPGDKDALRLIAEYYEYLQEYDSARVMLDKYFEQYPDEKDEQLRYRWARIAAWSREFDKAIEITDKLLQDYPNNLDYQLFRAQVSVWINRDIDLAKQYLDVVLKERPNTVAALVAMGSIKLIERDYDAAQDYENKAKDLDPNNDDVVKLQSNIDWQKMRAEEEKLYAILEQGRQKVIDKDCEGALPFYEDYMSKAEPNNLILKEYGDVLFCAQNYTKALETYNQVLSASPNFDAQMQRAKLYYTMGDSLNALKEFKLLVKQEPKDFDSNLYLADSYARVKEPDSARVIYSSLLNDWKLDSTQTKMIMVRRGWLPVTGIAAIFETFPNFIGIAPITSYYADNTGLRLSALGARLELGLTSYLSFGVTYSKTWIKADSATLNQTTLSNIGYFSGVRRYTTFKWHVFVRPSSNMNFGFGLGSSSAQGYFNRDEKDAFFHYEKKDTVGVNLTYQNSDASLILYSPYLIDIRYYAQLYKIDGYYQHRDGLRISGSFQYISVEDNNEGNDLILRIGRYFAKGLLIGYEYAYDNYRFKSSYYYSPNNFESHSLWLDQEIEKREQLRVTLGGKFGFIPHNSLIVLEGHVEAFYQPLKNLSFSGKLSIGNTSRDDSSYRYFSGQLSAYWTIF
jgi:tetratricopeptide (TPR) repeat protein